MFDSTLNPLWQRYILAVQEEVKPALGCTEPISLALAAAVAAAELEGPVERVEAWVSPNLMKNGLGVTVPGTGMVGLPIAAALGAIGGNAQAGLEVLKDASADALVRAKALLNAGQVQVKLQEPCEEILYSRACVYAGDASAMVTIAGGHTRVVEVVCQGETRFRLDDQQAEAGSDPLAVLSTTTLSQIDSSIGGKTAINLAGTKNTVGAFYQPSLVVADPDTLKSLPERHFINGLAEAVKAGLIADEGLFELFETEDAHEKIEEIVYRSLVMKKNVVERDEREAGLRATLNFGHTLGHAIESANHLGGLYHGECVALGMLPMIEDASLRRRTRAVYKKLGLPSRIRYDGDEIFEFIRHDKKTGPDGAITVVKVPRLGECRLDKVPLEDLKAIIGEGVR